jgi:hypothetical protein
MKDLALEEETVLEVEEIELRSVLI